jgi:hypothetical protein
MNTYTDAEGKTRSSMSIYQRRTPSYITETPQVLISGIGNLEVLRRGTSSE